MPKTPTQIEIEHSTNQTLAAVYANLESRRQRIVHQQQMIKDEQLKRQTQIH